MFLKSYTHIVPTLELDDYFVIEGLDRDCNFNLFYRKQNKDFLSSIEANDGLAVIYCPPIPFVEVESKGLAINKLQHTHAHKYAFALKNCRVDYVEIEGSACASSLAGIVKAYKLIHSGEFKDVLVITDERISKGVSDLFKQMKINIKAGDGFSALHLVKSEPKDSFIKITDPATAYHYHTNPWATTEEGYRKVIASEDYEYIKPHGTGTDVNDDSEKYLCENKKVMLSPEGMRYKDKYGHMQGASGATEICQMLEEHSNLPRTLCLAAGLGNFYAGLVIEKKS
jgi:hypothetical protein